MKMTRFLPLLVLFACVSCMREGPGYSLDLLPSGKIVKIIAKGVSQFTGGGKVMTLQYETDSPLYDVSQIRSEVNEIWDVFRKQAEKSNLDTAVITASAKADGIFIKPYRSINFVFKRNEKGQWRLVGNNENRS